MTSWHRVPDRDMLFPAWKNFLEVNFSKIHKENRSIVWKTVHGRSWPEIDEGLSEAMKDVQICEPVVSIKSVMKEADEKNLETLAEALLG